MSARHSRRYSRIREYRHEWTTRNDAYVPRHRRVSFNEAVAVFSAALRSAARAVKC